MTLHHLRVFAMVCQCKTMHAAAEQLSLSQPAISKIIADLEKYYGIQLFERINHRLYVTAMGQTVYGYALQILEMVQHTGGRNPDTGETWSYPNWCIGQRRNLPFAAADSAITAQ